MNRPLIGSHGLASGRPAWHQAAAVTRRGAYAQPPRAAGLQDLLAGLAFAAAFALVLALVLVPRSFLAPGYEAAEAGAGASLAAGPYELAPLPAEEGGK